jgi:phosphate transport system substrate-binding protein
LIVKILAHGEGDAMHTRMKGWATALTLLVLSVALPAAEGGRAAAGAGATLKIGGTGGALGTMKELAAAFEKHHPGIEVKIIPHLGTRGGINAVRKGAIDIGLAGRRLLPDEIAQGLKGVEYARSPFVFVSSHRHPGMNLSPELVARIYRGELKQWPDGVPIRPVLRPEGDVDSIMLKQMSPAISDALIRAASRDGMVMATDDQQNCDLLEKINGSFGTSTLAQLVSEKRALAMLPLNGVAPSLATMGDGSYPLFKPYVMVTGPRTSPPARMFMNFVASPAGKRILARNGNHLPTRSR